MKNFIIICLFLNIPLAYSSGNNIADFDTVKVITNDDVLQKHERVKDIAVAIPVEHADLNINIAPLPKIVDQEIQSTPSETNVPTPKIIKPSVNAVAIRALLSDNTSNFQACYQKALDSEKSPENLQGSIKLKFKILSSGIVENSEIISENFHSTQAMNCIKSVLSGIKFPEADRAVNINQPMNLHPKIK